MTPEPAARPSSRGARRRKKRSKRSGPKNSRNRSSISGEGPSSCPVSGFSLTLTLTTDGVARAATETKASSSARRSAFESGAGAGAGGGSAGGGLGGGSSRGGRGGEQGRRQQEHEGQHAASDRRHSEASVNDLTAGSGTSPLGSSASSSTRVVVAVIGARRPR